MFKFEMGAKMRDKITGFAGVITARAEYPNGYFQYRLEAITSTGALAEPWFEETRLEANTKSE